MLSYLCDRCAAPIASHEAMLTVRDRYRCRNFHREPCGAGILDALHRVTTPLGAPPHRTAFAQPRVA